MTGIKEFFEWADKNPGWTIICFILACCLIGYVKTILMTLVGDQPRRERAVRRDLTKALKKIDELERRVVSLEKIPTNAVRQINVDELSS